MARRSTPLVVSALLVLLVLLLLVLVFPVIAAVVFDVDVPLGRALTPEAPCAEKRVKQMKIRPKASAGRFFIWTFPSSPLPQPPASSAHDACRSGGHEPSSTVPSRKVPLGRGHPE